MRNLLNCARLPLRKIVRAHNRTIPLPLLYLILLFAMMH